MTIVGDVLSSTSPMQTGGGVTIATQVHPDDFAAIGIPGHFASVFFAVNVPE